MIVFTHKDCLKKFNGHDHPERKQRLESIISSIKSSSLNIEFKEAPLANLEIISLVHPKACKQIFLIFQMKELSVLKKNLTPIQCFVLIVKMLF